MQTFPCWGEMLGVVPIFLLTRLNLLHACTQFQPFKSVLGFFRVRHYTRGRLHECLSYRIPISLYSLIGLDVSAYKGCESRLQLPQLGYCYTPAGLLQQLCIRFIIRAHIPWHPR